MSKLKTLNLPFNENGRDFVIGDLHGCYDKLIQKMHDVSFDKYNDRLFSVGDLIDRGPKSFECLKLIRKPWFFSVTANHESMMCKALLSSDDEYLGGWLMNGGEWYKSVPLVELMEYVRYANELPYSIKVGDGPDSFSVCHTDPPSDWDNVTDPEIEYSIIWGRDRIQRQSESIVENVGTVYCGHTPRKNIVELGNVKFIDTGACFPNGHLTMIEVN